MVFMDYRFALKAALETTYTDALGRPLLDIAGYNTFRYLSLSAVPISYSVSIWGKSKKYH